MITVKGRGRGGVGHPHRRPFRGADARLIYRHLGKRPSCGSCLPLITKLMVAYDEEGPSTMPQARGAAAAHVEELLARGRAGTGHDRGKG